MKKISMMVLFIVCALLIVTGCGKKNTTSTDGNGNNTSNNTENKTVEYANAAEVTTTCVNNTYSNEGFSSVDTVVITSKNGAIFKETDKLVITFTNVELMNNIQEYYKNEYERQSKSYGGMIYGITTSDSQVIFDSITDYTKFDILKYYNDLKIPDAEVKDGYIPTYVLETIYEAYGYICNQSSDALN